MTLTSRLARTHCVIEPRVLYFGTPVVLVGTENPDRSANLAPMSSAWWVGSTCMLGLDETSATTVNLIRTGEVTLSLPAPSLAGAVNRLALTTGTPAVPVHKAAKNYSYVADKFAIAGLTPVSGDLVRPPWVAECPLALEGTVEAVRSIEGDDSGIVSVEVKILRTHALPEMMMPGSDRHIDPERWDPLLMKFTHLYGHTTRLEPSVLARGWDIPEPTTRQLQDPAAEWVATYPGVDRCQVADEAAVSRWHLRAGSRLPEHVHERSEILLVRNGVFRLDEGRVMRAGDVLTTAAGDAHGGEALIDTEIWAVDVH